MVSSSTSIKLVNSINFPICDFCQYLLIFDKCFENRFFALNRLNYSHLSPNTWTRFWSRARTRKARKLLLKFILFLFFFFHLSFCLCLVLLMFTAAWKLKVPILLFNSRGQSREQHSAGEPGDSEHTLPGRFHFGADRGHGSADPSKFYCRVLSMPARDTSASFFPFSESIPRVPGRGWHATDTYIRR